MLNKYYPKPPVHVKVFGCPKRQSLSLTIHHANTTISAVIRRSECIVRFTSHDNNHDNREIEKGSVINNEELGKISRGEKNLH
jgi:hypothetical protein